MTGCPSCDFYSQCTRPCPAAKLYANGNHESKERTLDAIKIGEVVNRDYRTVLSDMAAGQEFIAAYGKLTTVHRMIVALRCAGFRSVDISRGLSVHRNTVGRILALFPKSKGPR
jgi:hypothetical protein